MAAARKKLSTDGSEVSEVLDYIQIIDEVKCLCPKKDSDVDRLLQILRKYGKRKIQKKNSIQIVREHIPTGFLHLKEVWQALLDDMPTTALIRNVNKMSVVGLFDDQENVNKVISRVQDPCKLKAAKIHPMQLLVAKTVYEKGRGDVGGGNYRDMTWRVNDDIVQAFGDAFYQSFKGAAECKTGKKFMICLNVSTSMTQKGCSGCRSLTPVGAACAMALYTWNIEDDVEIVAFGGGDELVDLKRAEGFHRGMQLEEALERIEQLDLGDTNCALPMSHAREKFLEIDVFVVFTDSRPTFLTTNARDALRTYNKEMDRCAKFIVCGMNSSGHTVAHPDDPNMLDIVGFDLHVPQLICQFVQGDIDGLCGNECRSCRDRRD